MPSRILPAPDATGQRRLRRSRVVSYVLVAVAAVVLSLRPELLGDPQSQPWHALLHVWRIVVGLLLGVAALAVQVAVGVQWRSGLRRAAAADEQDQGSRSASEPEETPTTESTGGPAAGPADGPVGGPDAHSTGSEPAGNGTPQDR